MKKDYYDERLLINHKGQPCIFSPIFCQEGYCSNCQIYKQMNEYERVRELIARELASFDNRTWDDLEPKTIRFMQSNSQEVYLRRADSILSIKGIRIECDEQELPPNKYAGAKIGNFFQCWKNAQKDITEKGFVKCLKKDEVIK